MLPGGRARARARRAGPRRAGRARGGRPARRAQPRRRRPRRGRARRRRGRGAAPALAPTYRVDAALRVDEPDARPRAAARASRVHHGTRESPARLVGARRPLLPAAARAAARAARGDRLVIRSLAPPDTLGGGVVLDPRRAGTARRATCWRASRALERGERARAGARPDPRPSAGARARRAHASRRSRPRSACARPAHAPPLDPELDAADLAALRAPAAPSASARRCTSTPTRWPPSSAASSR